VEDTRLGSNAEQGRVIYLQTSARDGQIKSGKSDVGFAFVGPSGAGHEIDNFDGEFGRIVRCAAAGLRLFERQQKTAIGRLARAYWLTGKRGAPECGAGGKRDFYEVALIVANRIAGLHERFSFFAEQDAVTGFFDVSEQDRLLVITRNVDGKGAGLVGVTGAKPKRGERRRLAIGNEFAKIAGVGVFKALRFDVFDFASAENFNGSAARNTFGVEKLEQGNRDLAVAKEARFTRDDEASGLVYRFEEGNGELAGLLIRFLTGLFARMGFPVGDARAEESAVAPEFSLRGRGPGQFRE
jgi:hypothetical protein